MRSAACGAFVATPMASTSGQYVIPMLTASHRKVRGVNMLDPSNTERYSCIYPEAACFCDCLPDLQCPNKYLMHARLTSVHCNAPTKLRHVQHRTIRKSHIKATAMINVDGSPPLFLGAGMIAAGAILYQLRNSRPYVTKDFDIVLSCIAIFAGGILVFQVSHTRTACSEFIHALPHICCSPGMASRPAAAVWSTADSRCCTQLWG